MFSCRNCEEKEKIIELLTKQNKELFDRCMAFNKDAFITYQAETKQGEPLYPEAVDKDGKKFSYEKVDLKELHDETFRAFGEDMIEVEEDK